ncbi:MAG: hypothetical protein ACP5VE_15205 [Chthonomonadales bacterium]
MNRSDLHYPVIDPWEPRSGRRRSHRRRPSQASRWVKLGLTVILAVVAALLTLILIPPAPPEPASPQEEARVEQHVAEIKHEVEAAHADAEKGRPHPFTIRMTERELNTFLATNPQAQEILYAKEIERAFVRIKGHTIRATATRDMHGVPVSVTAQIRPILKPDHTLGFAIDAIDVGRLGLPEGVTRQAAQQIVRALAAKAADPLLKYNEVRVEHGAITLVGDTREPPPGH